MPQNEADLTIFATLLVVVQLAILYGWLKHAGAHAYDLLTTYLSPACWVTGFYLLWFVLPQLVALFPTHHLLGFESLHPAERLELLLPAQLRIIGFLLSMVSGYLVFSLFGSHQASPSRTTREWLWLDSLGLVYVLACFVGGVIAISWLGRELVQSEGARSQLVKTPVGLLLTIAGFFGNFAFAFLLARLVVGRHFIWALLVLGVFGTAVFLTGARGRLMWALVISTAFMTLYINQVNVRRFALLGIGLLSFLLLADAGLKAVRTGDASAIMASFEANGPIGQLFLKRNFDGFSNFAFVSHYDAIPHDPKILVNGSRDVFMNFYYPKVYASGVGFGVTYPGTFWLAGGLPGLLMMGFVFGFVLSLIRWALNYAHDERWIWSYLFAMVWFCALGGNFLESIDKLFTAASPPLIWLVLDRVLQTDRSQSHSLEEGIRYA